MSGSRTRSLTPPHPVPMTVPFGTVISSWRVGSCPKTRYGWLERALCSNVAAQRGGEHGSYPVVFVTEGAQHVVKQSGRMTEGGRMVPYSRFDNGMLVRNEGGIVAFRISDALVHLAERYGARSEPF